MGIPLDNELHIQKVHHIDVLGLLLYLWGLNLNSMSFIGVVV